MVSLGTKLVRLLPDWAFAVARYGRCHRALPNLIRPATFNEKVLHRILFDRQAWMAMVADKYTVRDFVRERVGAHLLPALYHVTTDPDTIPFATLPDRFVIKPTHGSGWVRVVPDKRLVDQAGLIRTCREWLRQNYYDLTREWIYKNIIPRILVEELIDDGSDIAPADYKLFVFNGHVALILVTMGRFAARSHSVVNRHWEAVDVAFSYSAEKRLVPPPPHFEQMVEAAEALGREVDFVRADFYDTAEKLFFGELTATPGCGLDSFNPRSFDGVLGSLWRRSEAA